MSRRWTWTVIAILALAAGVAGASPDGAAADHGVLNQVRPEYPPAALAAGFEGSVTLSAVVLRDGTVGSVTVVECDRPKLGFEAAAEEALKQWRFEPATLDGETVESEKLVRLHFRAPSRLKSDGWVSGGIVRSATRMPSAVDTRYLAQADGEGLSLASHGDAVTKHGELPPRCEGCLYSRSALAPDNSRLVDLPTPRK